MSLGLASANPSLSFTQQIFQVPVGNNPAGIQIVNKTSVVVGNAGDSTVSVFNPFSSADPSGSGPVATIGDIPSPAGIAAYINFALVVSTTTNQVFIIDTRQLIPTRTIHTGARPIAIAVDVASRSAVVSNSGDASLSVIDLTTLTVMKTIRNVAPATSLKGLGFTGRTAVVANTENNVVTVVDTTSEQQRTISVGRKPVTVDASGATASILNAEDGTVLSLDLNRSVVVRVEPLDVTDVQDMSSGYVTAGSANLLLCRCYELPSFLTIRGVPSLFAIAGGEIVIPRNLTRIDTEHIVAATIPSSNSVFVLRNTDNPLQVDMTTRQAPVNGASFVRDALAPGSLATLFASISPVELQALSTPLPLALGDMSLLVGGVPQVAGDQIVLEGGVQAPLLYTSPGSPTLQPLPQTNFEIPASLAPGPTFLEFFRNGQLVVPRFLGNVIPISPGIFQYGVGDLASQGTVLNQDNSTNGPDGLSNSIRPAARGSVIQIFATGAGETDPPLLPGEAAPATGDPLILTRVQPTVTIGGQQARVLFSGMAPGWVGLWQINAEIPESVEPGAAVPLSITADGVTSNTVTIAVE